MNDNRMTIYVNPKDRKDIEQLMTLLTKRGVDILDERKHPSVSKLFRYLRDKELNEIGTLTSG